MSKKDTSMAIVMIEMLKDSGASREEVVRAVNAVYPTDYERYTGICHQLCGMFGISISEFESKFNTRKYPYIYIQSLATKKMIIEGLKLVDMGNALGKHHTTIINRISVAESLLNGSVSHPKINREDLLNWWRNANLLLPT